MAESAGIGDSVDLILTDEISGAIVTVAVTRGRRMSLDRALVFLPDGPTLWFNADYATSSHRPDLAWTADGRAQRVRMSVHTAQDLEPAEHLLDADDSVFQVPLTVDLLLEPHSMPVPRQRQFEDGGLRGSQVYRASGSIAAGSVVYRVRGQAWVGETGFASGTRLEGARLQAAFQDGSAMLATAPDVPGGVGPGALQQHTATTPRIVSAFQVHGPARRIPTRLICQLDGDPEVTVFGGYRSLDQHLAFVQPISEAKQWVRRAYTPFDFARSGVTGFGMLEQIELVSSPAAPDVVGTGIPETF